MAARSPPRVTTRPPFLMVSPAGSVNTYTPSSRVTVTPSSTVMLGYTPGGGRGNDLARGGGGGEPADDPDLVGADVAPGRQHQGHRVGRVDGDAAAGDLDPAAEAEHVHGPRDGRLEHAEHAVVGRRRP